MSYFWPCVKNCLIFMDYLSIAQFISITLYVFNQLVFVMVFLVVVFIMLFRKGCT